MRHKICTTNDHLEELYNDTLGLIVESGRSISFDKPLSIAYKCFISVLAENFPKKYFYVVDANKCYQIKIKRNKDPRRKSTICTLKIIDQFIESSLREIFKGVLNNNILESKRYEYSESNATSSIKIIKYLNCKSMILLPLKIRKSVYKIIIVLSYKIYKEFQNSTLQVLSDSLENKLLSAFYRLSRYAGKKRAMEIITNQKDIEDVLIIGENRKCGILFADMRNFSNFVNRLDNDDQRLLLRDLMEKYYAEVVEIVGNNNGIISGFEGDGFLALYGIWKRKEQYLNKEIAMNMLESAWEMIDSFNKKIKIFWKDEALKRDIDVQAVNMEDVQLGIGMLIGKVTLIFFGPDDLQSYIALGKNVNLASRIVSLAGKNIEKTHKCYQLQFQTPYQTTSQKLKIAQSENTYSHILIAQSIYDTFNEMEKLKYLPSYGGKYRYFEIPLKSFPPITIYEIKSPRY